MKLPVRRLFVACFLLGHVSYSQAPCPPQWTPGLFTDGALSSGRPAAFVEFDDDGPGPAPCAFYAASTDGVVYKWTNAGWVAILSTSYGSFEAFAVFDEDGPGPGLPALLLGGNFAIAGGLPANGVLRWNGSAWSVLASGLGSGTTYPPYVACLAMHDEDGAGPIPPALYAGGTFAHAGGMAVNNIARWDGVCWSQVGTGLTTCVGGHYAIVSALRSFDEDGSGPQPSVLIATGRFVFGGGRIMNNIAKWDGFAWQGLGTGLTSPTSKSASSSTSTPMTQARTTPFSSFAAVLQPRAASPWMDSQRGTERHGPRSRVSRAE